MGLVSYFTYFDSVAYYCCLITHKILTVLRIHEKAMFWTFSVIIQKVYFEHKFGITCSTEWLKMFF